MTNSVFEGNTFDSQLYREKIAEIELRLAELGKERETFTQILGNKLYERLKDDASARFGLEKEFADIAAIDAQANSFMEEITQIQNTIREAQEAEQRAREEAEAARLAQEQAHAPFEETLICPSCGSAFMQEARFCSTCGMSAQDARAELEIRKAADEVSTLVTEASIRVCRQCGNPLAEGDIFCMECGHKVEEAQAPVPPAAYSAIEPQDQTHDGSELSAAEIMERW